MLLCVLSLPSWQAPPFLQKPGWRRSSELEEPDSHMEPLWEMVMG